MVRVLLAVWRQYRVKSLDALICGELYVVVRAASCGVARKITLSHREGHK